MNEVSIVIASLGMFLMRFHPAGTLETERPVLQASSHKTGL